MVEKRIVFHVIPSQKGGWAIVKEGTKRELHPSKTKDDAVRKAQRLSLEAKADYVVHRKDGSIQKLDAYGSGHNKHVAAYNLPSQKKSENIRSAIKAVYVVPQDNMWVVKNGGEEISSSDNVQDALDIAWNIRRERGTDIIVFSKSGKVKRSSSYKSFQTFSKATARMTNDLI